MRRIWRTRERHPARAALPRPERGHDVLQRRGAVPAHEGQERLRGELPELPLPRQAPRSGGVGSVSVDVAENAATKLTAHYGSDQRGDDIDS